MFRHKHLQHFSAATLIVLVIILSVQTKAITGGPIFPSAVNFDPNAGIQIASDIRDIAFLNVLDANGDNQSDLFVSSSSGEAGIVTKPGTDFRTFAGIKLPEAPTAQLVADVTGDVQVDLVSLIAPKLIGSKDWRYARITNVTGGDFVTDAILRKDILTQSTIIAPDGKQYQVKENRSPDDGGAIFLSKQLVPMPVPEDAPLPDFNTFLRINEYIAYLLPAQKITDNYQVIVHTNSGENNFAAPNCPVYIPRSINTITAMSTGDINADGKADLILTTHNNAEMNITSFAAGSPSYDGLTHTATLTMNIPAAQINGRDLRGSYFSFVSDPQTLFPIRDAGADQITVDFVLPDTGDGFETIKTALVPGERIHITFNDASNRKDLIYFGDGSGCFTLTDTITGTIFESSFGQVVLPGATEISTDSRSIITDPNNNFLPVDSLAGRKLQIGSSEYTIERSDQGHLFIQPADGDITDTVPDILRARIFTAYAITALSPIPSIDPLSITSTTAIVPAIPNEIQALTGTFRLSEGNPWLSPLDIDQDTDLDLVYIHDQAIFLKTNNEITP